MNASLASESLGRAELVFALGVGMLLVSGLLPWIAASEPIPVADPSEEAEGLLSFTGDNTSEEILGIDRIDWAVLAGGCLVATVLVVTEPWSRVVLGVAGASAVAVGGAGAVYLVDPAWMYSDWIKSDVAAVTSTGPGVYLALASSVAQFGGCYLGYADATSAAGAQQLDRSQESGRSLRQSDQPPHDSQQPRQSRSQQGSATGSEQGVNPEQSPAKQTERIQSDDTEQQ